jgi:hypothetical protein
MAATRLDAPVIRADVPPKSKKSKPASSEAKTVLDSPAVPLTRPPSTRRGKAKMVAPSQRQLSARKKDEIAARTRSEVAAEMPDSKRGGTASDTPALKPSGRAGADKGFSETQWFMKGMEVDADLLEMVEQEEYDRDDTISETDRKGFTLRRDDE